jgi:hypothetical protein
MNDIHGNNNSELIVNHSIRIEVVEVNLNLMTGEYSKVAVSNHSPLSLDGELWSLSSCPEESATISMYDAEAYIRFSFSIKPSFCFTQHRFPTSIHSLLGPLKSR